MPSLDDLQEELERVNHRSKYIKSLKSTLAALIVTAAVAALVATLFLPVLRIYGTSMTPTLTEGDIVVTIKTSNIERGDIVSFYYSNRVLVKRVVGLPFDTIDLKSNGDFYVNGELLEESYLSSKAVGECDIKFPYQVPEDSYFMVGDHRDTSVDSRSSVVGCITQDKIVGKVLWTIFPLDHIKSVR